MSQKSRVEKNNRKRVTQTLPHLRDGSGGGVGWGRRGGCGWSHFEKVGVE